jgi:L-amino acid N-acyltransferase YncA
VLLTIREFELSDISPANALTNTFIQATHFHFASEPVSDRDFHDGWSQFCPTYPWLAAIADKHFVGYAKSAPWRERHAYRYTVETTVYVDPAHARCGIGLALMTQLLARLSQSGFRIAIAGIALPNPASIALHEAIGYAPVGTFSKVGVKFGRAWDVGFWQKSLT